MPPAKSPSLDEILKLQTEIYGHPIIGYWTFFTKADAAAKIEEHVSSAPYHHIDRIGLTTCKMDSFLDVLYPQDPSVWKTLINIPGELEPFVVAGKSLPEADYFPTAVSEHFAVLTRHLFACQRPVNSLRAYLLKEE